MEETKVQKVLLVDDTPENIQVLMAILKDDYKVVAATSGKKALEMVQKAPPPDLILLDIMMPKMNGYMVLRKLRSMEATKNIPIIFVTAMAEAKNEAKGLLLGAVDYIVKPIQPEVVKARVRTQLKLQQAQQHIEHLYDETLTTTISLLTDLLSVTNPLAFSTASRIRLYMTTIMKELKLERYWEFDIAAMLSQIGCLNMDSETLEKITRGEELSTSEQESYDKHPEVGKRLLQEIPNMDNVGQIVGNQDTSLDELLGDTVEAIIIDQVTMKNDPIFFGSIFLSLSKTVERAVQGGMKVEDAFKYAASDLDSSVKDIVLALHRIAARNKIIKSLEIKDLQRGMVLEKDLFTNSHSLLLKEGSPITGAILERIRTFDGGVGLVTPVIVSIGHYEEGKGQ